MDTPTDTATEVTLDNTAPVEATAPAKPDPANVALQTRIDSTIKTAQDGGVVTDRVVDVFAERELKRRTDLIVQGMDLLVGVSKTFTDINKADQEFFTAPGDTATKTFSKKRIEEINKAKKTRDSVAKAVDLAISQAKFDELEKALKNKGKPEEDKAA